MKKYKCLRDDYTDFEQDKVYPHYRVIDLVTRYPQDWEEVTEESNLSVKDNINPDHYKNGKVECIDALEAATVNKTGIEAVCTANAVKYLWRYESKNGLEDVRKSKWYIEKLIKHLENETNT